MSLRNITAAKTKHLPYLKSSIFAILAALFIVFGSAPAHFAQQGNMYEEPWQPAARFAVQEGGRKEKATIALVKVENANFETGQDGLTFKICMAVNVKRGGRKAVKQYARTTIFRNDQSMAFTLKSWELSNTLPSDCH